MTSPPPPSPSTPSAPHICTQGPHQPPTWTTDEDDVLTHYVMAGAHCVPPPKSAPYTPPAFSWSAAADLFDRAEITPDVCRDRYNTVLSAREPTEEERLVFSVSYNGSKDRLWRVIERTEKVGAPWMDLGADLAVYLSGLGAEDWYMRYRGTMWLRLARVMMEKPIPYQVVEKLFWGLDEEGRGRVYCLVL